MTTTGFHDFIFPINKISSLKFNNQVLQLMSDRELDM